MTNPDAAPIQDAEESLYTYYQFPDGSDGYQRRLDPEYARRLLTRSAELASAIRPSTPSTPAEPYVDPREADPAGFARALLRRSALLRVREATKAQEPTPETT